MSSPTSRSLPADAHGPSGLARRWLLVAAAAALLSLGLRWSVSMSPGYVTIGWVGQWCHTSYDYDGWAYMQCDPTYSPGWYLPGDLTVTVGYSHPARVLLALAVLATLAGYRLGSRRLLHAAPALIAVGLFAFGTPTGPGPLAFALALAALLMALHRDGHLRIRGSPGHQPV